MSYVSLFFAGAFLCNCIPHLCSGLMGRPFPTPFAKPRGVGDSSPLANFLWGLFNLLVGSYLLSRHELLPGVNPEFATVVFGALVLGTHLSRHFERVQGAKSTAKSMSPS
jgi:hypothetical protein